MPVLWRLPWIIGTISSPSLVAQRGLGAQQVGSAHVAAAQVGAMASPATDAVERFAARDLRRVAGRALLSRNESAGPLPAAARASPRSPALAGCRAGRLARFLRRRDTCHQEHQH